VSSRFVERILTVVETCRQQQRLSLTFCGMPSWLIAPVKLLLHSYSLTNLKTIPDLPPERILAPSCSLENFCAPLIQLEALGMMSSL
jgi:hypothetical protein